MTVQALQPQLPYYPISQFYRAKFGEKVFKVPVSVAQTCPNREGLKGMQVCNFCDVWGSAAYPEIRELSLSKQIENIKLRIRKKYGANKFLVYFQAYTHTFANTAQLREQFAIAATHSGVVGFVVGTRPDCISEAVVDLWREYSENFFVAIELGVQSFDDRVLSWMSRGHNAEQSLRAIRRLSQFEELNLGIHLMLGAPGDNHQSVRAMALQTSALPIHNVKLHNIHVLKDTPLAEDYRSGLFKPWSREQYAEAVGIFLEHLRPDIAVHRLAALSSRHDELIAPSWTARRMETYQFIIDHLQEQSIFQGRGLITGKRRCDRSPSLMEPSTL